MFGGVHFHPGNEEKARARPHEADEIKKDMCVYLPLFIRRRKTGTDVGLNPFFGLIWGVPFA